MKVITVVVLVNFLAVYSFAQDVEDQILSDINTDTSLIRSQKIRSLHVFSELSEDNHDGTGNYLVDGYYEVFSDSLRINSKCRDNYMVNFVKAEKIRRSDPNRNVTYKPVIYLYPEEKIEISVKIDIHGSEKFLYPSYEESWEFTASPNGDLVFGEDTYNYLFWEAKSSNSISLQDQTTGFFVKKNEVVAFLEEKLTLANLTSKEKADFITFWAPILTQNELNFVHFIFNETCDQYAELEINPKPENTYRIYLIWAQIDEEFEIDNQIIKSFDRAGFHVVEWGGQEQIIDSKTAYLSH